jgi:hypothetical protein
MANVAPLRAEALPAFKTGELEWHHIVGGPEFAFPIDYRLAVLGAQPRHRRIDFLVWWAPDAYCHTHRHLADTTTLVLEGEHHIVEVAPTQTVHKTRRAGHFAISPAGDLHLEYGGSAGALVYFSMHAPDGRLYEVLGPRDEVLKVTTIDDLVGGRLLE